MGQCQSAEGAIDGPERIRSKSRSPSFKKTRRAISERFPRKSAADAAVVEPPMSPSDQTAATRPVSPDSVTSPLSSSPTQNDDKDVVEDEEEQQAGEESNNTLMSFSIPSLRHTEELSAVIIPEEVDPDAPSDEEEQHQTITASLRKIRGAYDEQPGPLNPLGDKTDRRFRTRSPPRPSSKRSKKMRRRRQQRNPNSIVYYNQQQNQQQPLLIPPSDQQPDSLPMADGPPSPGSVDRNTIAHFNKLRVQAKMAAHQQRKQYRLSKLEDRYQDVQEYRKLWKEFEDIQQTSSASSAPTRKLRRTKSFDLKDTKTWFFDFQAVTFEGDNDDDKSQASSLSLLSEKDREIQKRIFEEKSRLRRTNSEPCLSSIETTESNSKVPTGHLSLLERLAASGTAVSVRRKESQDGDSNDADRPRTPEPENSARNWNYAAEENDYGIKKSLEYVDPNELTPKRKTASEDQSVNSSMVVELDDDNDYHVPRRRRQPSRDFSEPLTLEEVMDAEILGISLPPSPQQASSDMADDLSTTSSLSEIGVLRLPSFDTVDSDYTEPTWRSFSVMRERVVNANADKCLEDVNTCARPSAVGDQQNLDVSKAPLKRDITNITSQEFLRVSDDHALVQVSRTPKLEKGKEPAAEAAALVNADSRIAMDDDPDVGDEVLDQMNRLISDFRSDHPTADGIADAGASKRANDGRESDALDTSSRQEPPSDTSSELNQSSDEEIVGLDDPAVADSVVDQVNQLLSMFQKDDTNSSPEVRFSQPTSEGSDDDDDDDSPSALHENKTLLDGPHDEIAADSGHLPTPSRTPVLQRTHAVHDAPLDELANLIRSPSKQSSTHNSY